MLKPIAKVPKILGVGRWMPAHVEWRLGTPLRAVHEAGLAITETVQWGSCDIEELNSMMFSSDLVIFQSPHSEPFLRAMKCLREAGIKVVVEHDDHPFKVSPTNEAYRYWGLKERAVVVDDDKVVKVWKDGEDGFDIERNRRAKRLWLSCLKESDAMIVTNNRLGDVMRRYKTWHYDKPIHTVPNLLDMRRWNRIAPVAQSPVVRIGWHGGWSHYADLLAIKPALEEITEKYPEVRLVFFGSVQPHILENIHPSQVELHPWESGTASFISVLKSLQIQIGIAPVVPGEFADCKSELKWVEYASQGIPVVATDAEPYASAINMEPGDDENWTGLKVQMTGEWVKALSALIERPAMRRGIGENALARIVDRYDSSKRADEIMAVYQEILDGSVQQSVPVGSEVVGSR